MSNYHEIKISALAMIAVTRCMRESTCRRTIVIAARDALILNQNITREKAELACWRAIADIEATQVPPGHYIDIESCTSQMLVIKTPVQRLVFTLKDLVALHDAENAAKRILPTVH